MTTNTRARTHTHTGSGKRPYTSFHYPPWVLYNNIRWGNNSKLSRTFHHWYQLCTLAGTASSPSLSRSPFSCLPTIPPLVNLSMRSPPTSPPPSLKLHLILWIKSDWTSFRLLAPTRGEGVRGGLCAFLGGEPLRASEGIR